MKHGLYAIYDRAAEFYMRVIQAQTDGLAIRIFNDEAVRADSEIAKHPHDYTLYKLGTFDDNNGEIKAVHTKLTDALTAQAAAREINQDKMEKLNNAVSNGTQLQPGTPGGDTPVDVQ